MKRTKGRRMLRFVSASLRHHVSQLTKAAEVRRLAERHWFPAPPGSLSLVGGKGAQIRVRNPWRCVIQLTE